MNSGEKKYRLKEVKALGQELLSSTAHINNLPVLLSFISPQLPPQHALESILSLQSFFTPLLPDLPPSSTASFKSISIKNAQSNSHSDAQLIYSTWLRSKFDEFVSSLTQLLLSPLADHVLREVALDTLMEFVKVGNGGHFHSAIYYKLLRNVVHSEEPVDFVLELLISKYYNYIDTRYFTYICLEKLCKSLEGKCISDDKRTGTSSADEKNSKASMEFCIRKIQSLLSSIPKENSNCEMWGGSGNLSKEGESKEIPERPKAENKQNKSDRQNNNVLSASSIAKKMKLKFTKAWITFLRLPLPLDVYKEVLSTLHEAVIPRLSNPIMLCDFLTRSYDIGGVVSVMALNSLFILMTQHGLEYPNFYEKLYALLLPSIFMAKHRAKFFQLLDSCLKSPLLPAYLAASFAKKLSRLSLSVPPSGALVIIALIHNLLRRHPSINCLVHRENEDDIVNGDLEKTRNDDANTDECRPGRKASSTKPGTDLFDNEERNPMRSNALRSSLWEIDTLRHHYCPPVSRFVLSLENDLTVRSKTTEVAITDFSGGSYATIFGEEIRRRVKQVPLAFYKTTPTSLFSESDFVGWTFKEEEESKAKSSENGTLSISEGDDNSSPKRRRLECS
ncbi:hypothetical protein K2173_009031 [Erythroxylum novogranatense]|uniref:CCAAT-binding factor domain-containing protein n=1 Tax=Erythroxylum novogranatense TaxID=1862640 RepID=A0AAV8TVJ7_9ROSI|nr:hypothetical protein K2173_009031 [Erythroxylum novogranatense]